MACKLAIGCREIIPSHLLQVKRGEGNFDEFGKELQISAHG